MAANSHDPSACQRSDDLRHRGHAVRAAHSDALRAYVGPSNITAL